MPNRLAREKSPYLLQHAQNPVDWYPWGEEAFRKAQREQKPVFLSIGYSSCHWCHVMEEESFADEEVAAALNESFVAIKVDREERPDVDEVYMDAVVYGMRVQGGWPLNLWLTPDRKPFFGGTYFPKLDHHGRPGFVKLLRRIAELWADPEQRKRLQSDGAAVAQVVGEIYAAPRPEPLPENALDVALEGLGDHFDSEYGGFSSPPHFQPKFPNASALELLLRRSLRPGGEGAGSMLEKSMLAMAQGGIRDQIGGGFHRYSVTRDWLIPHFEKMLYDNAQLLGLFAWAHLATGDARFRETALATAEWMLREMRHEEGGFYSAQDADDPGGPEGEGGYYTWTLEEIREALPEEQARGAETLFGLSERGNWPERPGRNLLAVRRSVEDVARTLGRAVEETHALLEGARKGLLAARSARSKPSTDEKILTEWNALAISGLCLSHQALGEESHLVAARAAAEFLVRRLYRDGRLLRRWCAGEAAHDGVLSDYAYCIAAFLDLFESSLESRWLGLALELERATTKRFLDAENGGYFATASDAEALISRPKSGVDQACPSGNGVMAKNLFRIAELTADEGARRRGEETLRCFSGQVLRSALGFASLWNAYSFSRDNPRQIFLAGAADDPRTRALAEAIWRNPDRDRVLAIVTPETAALLPPAAGKTPRSGQPAAYVCKNFACGEPVTDPARLR